jgi:pre-mRNA-splicing factor ATP-dependent RNA helicase DHX16
MEDGKGEIKTWVWDWLMALLGYSQRVVVQLVVRLARDCASVADLAARLVDLGGFPSSPDTAAFAEDVYARVQHKPGAGTGGAVSEYQRQMQDAAALVKKQSEFKLLDDDDDEEYQKARVSSFKETSSRKRFRTKVASHDEEKEDDALSDPERIAWRQRRCPEDDEDRNDPDEEEEELRRDQAERAQLERNIRERDEAKTSRLMDRKPSKHEQAELVRRSETVDSGDTSRLRRASRHTCRSRRSRRSRQCAMRSSTTSSYSAASGSRTPRRGTSGARRKSTVS